MAGLKKSFKYVIEANRDQMTASEALIADYFLNLKAAEELDGKTVAKKLGVSLAGLSRFAKKCGLSGYREFVSLFKNSFVSEEAVTSENSQLVLWSYQEILNRQYSLVDEEQIARIAGRLTSCRHFYLAGRGNSGLAAEEITGRFRWLGIDARCIRDLDEMKLSTLFLQEDDIVMGLSISGKQKELLYLLNAAGEKGAHTILATANNNKILRDRVDELVLVPALKNLNYGNLISPQFPLLLLGDMIYGSFVAQNETAARQSQQMVQETLYGN